MRVYVKNLKNLPLMPTTPRKARMLLKENKAKVVKRTPFTIQLLYATGETKQDITLGVDAGSKVIGLSATTVTEELFSSEVELRNDIVDLLSTRRQNRRTRRNRLRYRKPRFDNRKRSEGWLAPSVGSKINSHLRVIEDVYKILPIAKTIVETASFDIQKIKNPDIQGEDYQKGEQLGFWNVREYVLFRDGHKCLHCKGKSKDKILNVHHLESRKTGGDSPNNLITLCETCRNKYHKGGIDIKVKRGQSFKDAAFMGIMRWALYNKLKELYPNVSMTYGYITKNTRIRNGLPKEHRVDALCITGNPTVKRLDNWHFTKQVRKKKRSLHEAIPRKGRKTPNITSKRNSKNTKELYYKGLKWCLWDKVLVGDKIGFISGFTGNAVYVQDIEGNYIQVSPKYKQVSVNSIKLISRNNNWVCQEVAS